MGLECTTVTIVLMQGLSVLVNEVNLGIMNSAYISIWYTSFESS